MYRPLFENYECGYYDHAHHIKDFKMLSDETPAVFFRQKRYFQFMRLEKQNNYLLL